MNVTLNSSIYTPQTIQKQNNQPSFKGNTASWLSKNYTEKLYTSKFAQGLANKADKLQGVVDHMQVAGSVIVTSTYMGRTLANPDFDEDRKKTLAINQGLTFVLSTFGSYLIDNKLNNWWEGVTQKYASKKTGINVAEAIKTANEKIKANGGSEKDLVKNTLEYFNKFGGEHKNICSRIESMGILKKLLVFGTVYRFISPVAVTPFANWMGNKIASKKQEAQQA